MKKAALRFLMSGSAVAVFGLLLSCPNPILKAMLTNVKDSVSPNIVINSPAEGSCCANIVEVVGTVTDAATSAGNDGQVRSLSYAVTGSTVVGGADFASDGSFSFQFSTVTLGTNFTLSITAVDWNGNSAVVLLPLMKQLGNGIPSFVVTSGNKQMTLTWDSVPHTTSYTLYYTTNGTLPSEQVGRKEENVISPCLLSDLANGSMHVFQLKSVPETGWPVSVSDYLKAIPLSAQTLAPRVTGENRQIRIEWDAIPAVKEFEVWRSTEQNGTYYNLSGPVTGTSYLDKAVENDHFYWYKVRPTLSGSVTSFPNGAQADPFYVHHPVLLSACDTAAAFDVVVRGSYAYVIDRDRGLLVIDIANPILPIIRGTYSVMYAEGIALSETAGRTYAYVTRFDGLLIVDVTDPSAPRLESTFAADEAKGVAVGHSAGRTYAYITGNSGFVVVDVTDPAFPSSVGTCNGTGLERRCQRLVGQRFRIRGNRRWSACD